MYKINLNRHDIKEINQLLDHLALKYSTVEQEDFLIEAPTYAQELPKKLRSSLNSFRLQELGDGVCLITGYPIEDDKIGMTPSHWKNKPVPSPTIKEDLFFFLCSCLLGDPIGWATQQDGYILHDILPIKGHESEQLGSGSETLLTWHTEEAFHPYRADYLGLMCLRNHDCVETTYATLANVELDERTKSILFEKRFTIRPDESHLEKNRSESTRNIQDQDLLRRSYARMNQMNTNPEKVAVLFGDPNTPYIRLDPYFMDHIEEDSEAMNALNKLIEAVDKKITGYSLQPGEILFLDNYKTVHGRKPFKARYDGTDRWLKRLNIARDLRKSRDSRLKPESRIIF